MKIPRLTKKDLDTLEGQALFELLERTMSDGRLTDQEVKLLEVWLKDNVFNTIPGIQFLREEVAGVLVDGSVSDDERNLLQWAILRVLPVAERKRAKAKIADVNDAARIAEWNSVTIKQRDYIRALGGVCPANATKASASEIIDELLDSRRITPTVRQQMVLRFWDQTNISSMGVEGVSNWMDQWYKEDPYRITAWELWKRDVGDNGSRSPDKVPTVPIGVGYEYLQKVKKGGY